MNFLCEIYFVAERRLRAFMVSFDIIYKEKNLRCDFLVAFRTLIELEKLKLITLGFFRGND